MGSLWPPSRQEAEPPSSFTLPDGSTVSLQQLDERVTVVEPGIVMLNELQQGTRETLHQFGEIMREKANGFERYVHLVDLSNVAIPSAEYRETIVEWMKLQPCVHTCFVQPGFIVVRVALRFMIGRAGTSMSIHASLDEAVVAARTYL